MKRNYKQVGVIGVAFLVGMLTVGCGSSDNKQSAYSGGSDYYSASDDLYSEMAMVEEEAAYESDNAVSAPTEANLENVEVKETGEQRKLIKNYSLSVETTEFSTLLHTVEAKVEAFGGYIESSSIDTRSYGTHYAYYTIRIPKKDADHFVSAMEENSNITSQSVDVQDVTLQYVDLSSHKTALITEQDRLLELLKQAETMEDIIALEERLSNVRYQIESMESQLRTYDNQVDYSTIRLDVTEVVKLSEPAQETIWGRITEGFGDSLVDIGTGFVNAFVWILVKIPYIILWALILFIIWFIILKIEKGSKKKRLKKKRMDESNVIEQKSDGTEDKRGDSVNQNQPEIKFEKEPKEGEE